MPTTTQHEVKWNLALQYSGFGLMLVQGVLLVPVYLRYVGRAEFGLWLVASGVAAWVGVVDPGISALMQQRVSHALGREHRGQAVRLARRGLWLNAALAVLIVGAGALLSDWIARLIDPAGAVSTRTAWWLVFLSVAGVAAGLVANALTSLGVALRAARPHTIATLASAAAGIIATLGGLALGWGVLALAIGVVVRCVLQALLATPIVRRDLAALSSAENEITSDETPSLDRRVLAWAAFEKIAGTVSMSADLFLVGRGYDAAMVTSYGLTKRPVDLLLGLFQRPTVALTPVVGFMSGESRAGELGAVLITVGLRMLWLLGGAVLGTTLLLEPLVGIWIGSAQFVGGGAAGFLAALLGVSVGASFFANLCFALGETKRFYQLNGSLSLLAIPAMLGGLHYFGIAGLLVGALLPRAVAFWWFGLRAISALRTAAADKRAILGEFVIMMSALIAGLVVDRLMPAEAWISGISGLVAYAAVVAGLSRRFRSDLRRIAEMGLRVSAG